MTFISDGITIRGCLASHLLTSECGGNTCTSCKSDKCNAQIFPEDRLTCLHCQGESCVNQTNTIEVRHPCVNYTPNDECYTVFSRGNYSDISSLCRCQCTKMISLQI